MKLALSLLIALIELLFLIGIAIGGVLGVYWLIGSWWITLAIVAIPLVVWLFVVLVAVMTFFKILKFIKI